MSEHTPLPDPLAAHDPHSWGTTSFAQTKSIRVTAPTDPVDVDRILVIAAHPDDIDLGAGGTIAKLTPTGATVTAVVCTSGGQGGFDDTDREKMPGIRRQEQRDALALEGVTDVRFFDGYDDGYVEPTHELQRDIVRVIRQVKPQRVIIPSPQRWWEMIPASHPDHLAVGEASIRAIYPAARNAFAYPELLQDEGLEPWTVREVWLMGHPEPDHCEDITHTLDVKIDAILAHRTQFAHLPEMGDVIRELSLRYAQVGGLEAGRAGELFKVVHIDF